MRGSFLLRDVYFLFTEGENYTWEASRYSGNWSRVNYDDTGAGTEEGWVFFYVTALVKRTDYLFMVGRQSLLEGFSKLVSERSLWHLIQVVRGIILPIHTETGSIKRCLLRIYSRSPYSGVRMAKWCRIRGIKLCRTRGYRTTLNSQRAFLKLKCLRAGTVHNH